MDVLLMFLFGLYLFLVLDFETVCIVGFWFHWCF